MDEARRQGFPIRAVVFDFDGLILDTESAAFRTWSELYAAHDVSLALERWVHCVGTDTTHFDPYSDLEQQLGLRSTGASSACACSRGCTR